MAPTFRHGKNTRLIVNSVDASSLFSELTLTSSVDTAEVTAFADGDRHYIAGQRMGTISASGMLDASTAGTGDPFRVFRTALGSTAPLVVTAIPGGPGGSTVTPGSLTRMAHAIETSLETGAPAMGVVTAKFDAQAADRLDYGRTLYGPGAAITGTLTGTAIDGGSAVPLAGTTGGGVGHLHVVAQSTVTSFTIKVQHSSATGSGWADLLTFTSPTTSTGSQRLATSANVKRYTRLNVSAFTGGASKSISVVASFARRGPIT